MILLCRICGGICISGLFKLAILTANCLLSVFETFEPPIDWRTLLCVMPCAGPDETPCDCCLPWFLLPAILLLAF